MKTTHFPSSILNFRRCRWKLAVVLMCLFFARVVFSQTWVNTQNSFFTVPGTPALPTTNVLAFDNQSIFSVTYAVWINNQIQYVQPWWGTLYYTNNGEMMVNAPFNLTNSLDILTTGVGFQFDLQQGSSNVMAGTFYNPGVIHCNSVLDGNNVINLGGFEFFEAASIGGCIVSATNIINPGTIVVGINGRLKITGQNVDLNRSTLELETVQNLAGLTGNGGFSGNGIFGVNTNLWDPSANLTLTRAFSAPFPIAPFQLALTNSTPYNQQVGIDLNRSAFVQDMSPTNVTYSVYFGPTTLGSGDLTIGWVGTYLNYATGQYITNYLYLNDDYLLGSSTNVAFGANGYPDNFTLTQSPTPVPGLPTASTPSLPVFPAGGITNSYSYANFVSDSLTTTNPSGLNPSGALTNVPNRIEITASHDLNLALAEISGPSYLSLTATNEFDGSAGADITAPYADLNLASTNGFLTISNLLQPQIPDWTGTIEAWSTRFLSTNNPFAITDDWRVVLVDSQLQPVTVPFVQNLTLNATNSLIISDVLNVFGTFFVTPQSLTLTTNLLGMGAGSPDGELNLENAASASWSWQASFPNLLWLTNNGAIRVPNFSDIVSSTQTVTVIPGIPATSATATLSGTKGTNNVALNSTVTFGTTPAITYTFTNTINSKAASYTVLRGTSFIASMTNLIAAINHSTGAGKIYSTNKTYANTYVTAGGLTTNISVGATNFSFTVTANGTGPNWDAIAVATTAGNLAWSSATLMGGSNAVPGTTNFGSALVPYGAIVNDGLFADQGSSIWVNNFVNGGVISNGVGSFTLNTLTATMTNGQLVAGSDVSLTADTLETSNLMLQAGRSLTLEVTNWITDDGVTNGNFWTVGSTNSTGFSGQGLNLPFLPANNTPGLNTLLGTLIAMQSPPPNKRVATTWAANDFGATTMGYTANNMAIGQLSLNSVGPNSTFYFSGTGNSNAIYVDRLILNNYASYANGEGTADIPTIIINTNMVIYYADAVATTTVTGGPLIDVSYLLNHSNGNRIRWVPSYAGFYSSTNVVYANGSTNALNIGLLTSPFLDSNGNGIPNAFDPNPIFTPSQVNFKFALTNIPPFMALLTWDSIPSSTNTIFYTTNLSLPMSNWQVVTNFISPSAVPPVGGWPITNVVIEPLHMTSPHGFYRVTVNPNNADVYGQ